VVTERSETHQNYLGFLNQTTGEATVFETNKGNGLETVKVLKKLVASHCGKRFAWSGIMLGGIKEGQVPQGLHLIAFPPSAPETNPIEHVWQYAKG